MLPQSHEDFRRSVCVGCHKPGCKRKVSELLEPIVREKIFSGYSVKNKSLPLGVCQGCSRQLKKEKKFFKMDFDYDDLTRKMSRRDVDEDGRCLCYICAAGRSKKKICLKRKKSQNAPKKINICNKCNQKIGKGISHPCVKSRKVDNLRILAEENNNVSEQLASAVINEKGDKPDSEIALKNRGGRPLRVKINPKTVQKKVYTHEEMNVLAQTNNFSTNRSVKTARVLRKMNGKGSIEPYYRESLAARKKRNAEFLVNKKLRLMDSKKVVKETDVVVLPKVTEYAEFLRKERNIAPENCHLRIGFDNGGNFYKGTLSLLDKSADPQAKPKFGELFKDTGVKKLSVIELAQNIKENYDNCSTLFKENDFEELDQDNLTYCGDQKMEYCMTGKGGPTCKKCCNYCRAQTPLTGEESAAWLELYTLGMLRELNREYVANGSKAKDAMHYDNVINWPLLTGPDDKLVLDMFPPPQLHLMIRIVNHILDNLSKVSKKWYGQDYVLDFVKQTGIARQDYHGGGFEGRVVNKISRKIHDLLVESAY